VIPAVLSLTLLAAAASTPAAEAERLIAEAQAALDTRPETALACGQRALEASHEFDPTEFVAGGRRGEVVDDAFLEARRAYRMHRSRVYAVVGRAFARLGKPREAVRFLQRAEDLHPGASRQALVEALLASHRPAEALDGLLASLGDGRPAGTWQALAGRVADALGLACLQAEIDRTRLTRLAARVAVGFHEGAVRVPGHVRLSTGAPLRLQEEERVTAFYLATADCTTCSADLELLARVIPDGVRPVIVPPEDDDRVLRQALRPYRRDDWLTTVGAGIRAALGAQAPSVVVVARRGWSAGVARPPLARTLPSLLAVFAHRDVSERLPRAAWRGVSPSRSTRPRPAFAAGGLAPGEDAPFPAEFERATEALAHGETEVALRWIDVLAARRDGWLLPPEARLDRALILLGAGRRNEARSILRGIGDSRFQERVDALLEQAGGLEGRPGVE